MAITIISTFAMKPRREPGALRLVAAVKRQAEQRQPGTLVYLVHRVLGSNGKPTRQLYFYECYQNKTALTAHLDSSSWKKLQDEWTRYFEGTPKKGIKFFGVRRIAAFARAGAIPSAPKRGARRR